MKQILLHTLLAMTAISVVAGVISCQSYREAVGQTRQPSTPLAPKQLSTARFLGLRDNESRKIGDYAPESALRDITSVSAVSVTDYADYHRALASGEVTAHVKRNGYIYYAIKHGLHVPFPNGSSAWVIVTERHKARLLNE